MKYDLWCAFCVAFRRQCVTNPIACSFLGAAVILWIVPFLLVLVSDSNPMELLGADNVQPTVVKQGGTVYVTRSVRYRITGQGVITRKLRTSKCVENCTDIEMDSGTISFKRGEVRLVNNKSHYVPVRTPPGMWDLRCSLVTTDILGRPVTTDFPVLTIEVIR